METTENEPRNIACYFVVLGKKNPGEFITNLTENTYEIPDPLYSFPTDPQIIGLDNRAITYLCLPYGVCILNKPTPNQLHTFVITREDGKRYYGSCLTIYEEITKYVNKKIINMKKCKNIPCLKHLSSDDSRFFIQKCTVFISYKPLYNTLIKYLRDFAVFITQSNPTLPLESYIYNILYEVTTPLPNEISILKSTTENSHLIYTPNSNDLPLLDLSLKFIFEIFSIDTFLQLFTCLLLEHRILIQSSDLSKLTPFAECINNLLFPFAWPHVYIPILPASQMEFLEAPIPFIIGHYTADLKYLTLSDLSYTSHCCIVNLDNGLIDFSDVENCPLPYMEKLKQQLEDVLLNFSINLPAKSAPLIKKSSITELMRIVQDISNKNIMCSIENLSPPRKGNLYFNGECLKQNICEISSEFQSSIISSEEENDLLFTAAIRNVFYTYFLKLFQNIEQFVIHPDQNERSINTFDKTVFPCENSSKNMEFLSKFMETQMFTTLIDYLIAEKSKDIGLEVPNGVYLFLNHLHNFKHANSNSKCLTPPDNCYYVSLQENLKNCNNKDLIQNSIVPHSLKGVKYPKEGYKGLLPALINTEAIYNSIQESNLTNSGRKNINRKNREKINLNRPLTSDFSVTYSHAKFVMDLLRECSMKIKHLVLHQLQLPVTNKFDFQQHFNFTATTRNNVNDYEESTLIANLCEIIERIWCHGLKNRSHTQSALWRHLTAFQNKRENNKLGEISAKPVVRNRNHSFKSNFSKENNQIIIRFAILQTRTTEERVIEDIKYVQSLTDIITEAGKVRAWIRLQLEKQTLQIHLKALISDTELLNSLYRSNAFLNTQIELEQFLYHLLSLSCLEFSSFTCGFRFSQVPYTVFISCHAKRFLKSTSNMWIILSGTLDRSEKIEVKRGENSFRCSNLGHLLGIRIGHDNSGFISDIFIESIFVRNEGLDDLYHFPANKWLSDSEDDFSCERYFPAEHMSEKDIATLVSNFAEKPCLKEQVSFQSDINSIKDNLNRCVRSIIHYFTETNSKQNSLTYLLLGKDQLMTQLEDVLTFGLFNRSSKNKQRICDYLQTLAKDDAYFDDAELQITFLKFRDSINANQLYSNSTGANEWIRLILFEALRAKYLHNLFQLFNNSTLTKEFYSTDSFLLSPELNEFIFFVIATLRTYQFNIDSLFTIHFNDNHV